MAEEHDVRLLVVDDDELSRRGIRRALKQAGMDNPIYEARDGLEALDWLRGTNGKIAIGQPCTVILDLRMPRMSGLEFLEVACSDLALASADIIVMTTSDSEFDRRRAHSHDIAGYVVKSGTAASYLKLVEFLRSRPSSDQKH